MGYSSFFRERTKKERVKDEKMRNKITTCMIDSIIYQYSAYLGPKQKEQIPILSLKKKTDPIMNEV